MPATKRIRTVTNRYGSRDSSGNYDEIMESLDIPEKEKSNTQAQAQASSSADIATLVNDSTSIDLSQSTLESIFVVNSSTNENDNYALLQMILKKVDAIEDHLIKLDVRIANVTNDKSRTSSDLRSIDKDEQREFGLPVRTESELKKLDTNLESNDSFRDKLVSQFQFIN